MQPLTKFFGVVHLFRRENLGFMAKSIAFSAFVLSPTEQAVSIRPVADSVRHAGVSAVFVLTLLWRA